MNLHPAFMADRQDTAVDAASERRSAPFWISPP
jgi:hypothetical protein